MKHIMGVKWWAKKRDRFFRTRAKMDRVRQKNDKMIRKQEAREKVRAVLYSATQCYTVLYSLRCNTVI